MVGLVQVIVFPVILPNSLFRLMRESDIYSNEYPAEVKKLYVSLLISATKVLALAEKEYEEFIYPEYSVMDLKDLYNPYGSTVLSDENT